MGMIRLLPILVVALVTTSPRAGAAPTPDERCEAYQLAAAGQRISAKLHCRAWAKLTGTAVDQGCLDKAEKRFAVQLGDGGPGCAAPDEVVSLGAAADAQMSAVVADIQPDAPSLPSLSGAWVTRTSVSVNADGGTALPCEFYEHRPCPTPDLFLIVECRTQILQEGTSLDFASTCATPADSPLQLAPFTQAAVGAVDVVTGEWLLEGTVEVNGLPPIAYQGEGVFGPDGRTQTGFTTAGYGAGPTPILWLASTTGQRVD